MYAEILMFCLWFAFIVTALGAFAAMFFYFFDFDRIEEQARIQEFYKMRKNLERASTGYGKAWL